MQKGVRRWLVDISQWNPSLDRFSFLVSLLPPHEHSAITRFVKFEDRKRALVSRLLQYSLVHKVLDIPFDEIIINRTDEGKPYLVNCVQNSEYPNFNFNASHSGDYVGIASEPLCLVGFDIVSNIIPKQETTHEYIRNFSSYFTSLEWNKIINAGTSDEILAEFYRYWCLKEAYVKAIGSGVGFGLDRLEFHHTEWTNITISIDGKDSKEWRFWLFELGKNHLASIARGHPKTAVESYQKNLMKADIEEEEFCSGFWLPNPSFILCTVEELIPVSHSDGCIIYTGRTQLSNQTQDLYIKVLTDLSMSSEVDRPSMIQMTFGRRG